MNILSSDKSYPGLMNSRSPLFLASVLLLCMAFSNTAWAQTGSTASISGTVTDPLGASVQGATVELRSIANNKLSRQITNETGQYTFASVPFGEYKVNVIMKGFHQSVASIIKVDGARNYPLDVSLEVTDVLESVVVTGTRSEQEIGKIASAVSVINRDEIQKGQRVSTLEESLKRVSGVRVEDELGGNGSRVRIIVRGAGTRANSPAGSGVRGVKVLVDGLPKNNAGGSAQDLTNIDLQSAQRIEVLKGPSSVLYGNQSGGVVNILTEDPPAKPTFAYRQTFGA